MKLSTTSTKLVLEILRLKDELSKNSCTALMLINALYAIRDAENADFTNLFYTYMEKVVKVKSVEVEKAFLKLSDVNKDEVGKHQINVDGITESCETMPISFEVDDELYSVLASLEKFMAENNRAYVRCDYFTVMLFESDSKTLRVFLKEVAVNYMDMRHFFKKEKIFSYEIVPYEVSTFIKYANPLYKGKKLDIVGREENLKEIYRIMLKSNKRNVIIYGEPGVGKSAVGEKFIHEISNGQCPERFKHFKILEMSVKDFLLNCDDSRQANEKMNFLMEFLTRREDDIILVIDEIQSILGKGGLFEQKKLDLSATLKPILARGEIRIVGITTNTDYYTSFASDPALSRRFEGVEVKEVKYKNVHVMIAPRVRAKEAERGIRISDELIDDAIWYAACFEYNKCNPDKSIDVIDRAMANAQLENRDYVVKQDIIDVFRISYKRWNGMEPLVKKSTAFHEAGHYVTSMVTKTRDYDVLAVSIYPTDDYQGVNVFEFNDDITPVMNRQYYIDSIAIDLAGRVAEEMILHDVTSGASSDLDNAAEKAHAMIMSYGLGEGKLQNNRVFLADDMLGLGSEETTKDVEDEVERVIKLGYKRAEELLKAYKDYLEAIADGLLRKQILRKEELDRIWNEVTMTRIKNGLPVDDLDAVKKGRKKLHIDQKISEDIARHFKRKVKNVRRKVKKFFK